MAILITPYTDINATMRGIRTQVIDSLEYCVNEMPSFSDPETMFKYLKTMVKYHSDPPGVELLQTVQTLFDNNYWGIRGAGDCDCFSILFLAMCVANGFNDQEIVLAGRSKSIPVHIWTRVKYNGKWYDADLTQTYFNTTRNYPYTQYLRI